jgi:hypothetical protein
MAARNSIRLLHPEYPQVNSGSHLLPLEHRAVTFDNVAQEMKVKKVLPKNMQIWGAPQVMRIKWECTGSFSIIKKDYVINYVVVDKNNRKST